MTNKVGDFLRANTLSPVISGAVLHHGGGCYVLANGRRYDWSKEDMEEHIRNGGIFEPTWKVTCA